MIKLNYRVNRADSSEDSNLLKMLVIDVRILQIIQILQVILHDVMNEWKLEKRQLISSITTIWTQDD